jgi:hypothetical protein
LTIVQGAADVRVHAAGAVDLAHPVVGVGPDAKAVEGVDEDAGEMPGIRGVAVAGRVRHVRERHAHRALDCIGGQQSLGVHRVEVVDAIAQLDLATGIAERAGNRVDHDRPAEAADVDRARRCLRVVDDLAAPGRRRDLVSPEHARTR